MAKLDSITIKGFKSIASIEQLPLGAINIVIGANGSGKSNFIGVFSFLHAVREGRLRDYVIKAGGADKVLHFGSKSTPILHIRISFAEGRTGYEIGLSPTATDSLALRVEGIFSGDEREPGTSGDEQQKFAVRFPSQNENEAGISGKEQPEIAGNIRDCIDSWQLYHFHDTGFSSPMKKTADVNDNRYLRADAANLASFLYYLRVKHEASYSLIRRTIQRVAPFFDDFQLEPQRLNPEKIRLEWRHKGSDAYFDASSLSDGTLRFIALATLFLQPEEYRPSIILVDEPELGLHPYAITLFASLVKQAAASGKTQVILSTQSPLLLDHFQPEDVLVADRVDGGTQFTRLDSAKLAAWLDDYSLGQLWEKNELGGRPAGE